MTNKARLFIGRANYEFGSRYVLLHITSGVCINFSSPAGLGNYLLENYGKGFHRRVSYRFNEENEIEHINEIRGKKGLEDVVYYALETDEAKIIDDVVDKISH